MHEKREAERQPVHTDYTFGNDSLSIRGQTFDVTEYGVGLISDKEMDEGFEAILSIPGQNIRGRARVIWCTEDNKRFKVGVRLI
ncbi:MAG: PilZ domain-containing protein [Deltaproteobacteria bacterium]|nr:PilZ domain-containing protein [Deltaproteobacteria bacterium]